MYKQERMVLHKKREQHFVRGKTEQGQKQLKRVNKKLTQQLNRYIQKDIPVSLETVFLRTLKKKKYWDERGLQKS